MIEVGPEALPNFQFEDVDIMFQVMLDVRHFAPDDICVKVYGNLIHIYGSHDEQMDPHGFVTREFTRTYELSNLFEPRSVCAVMNVSRLLLIRVLTDGDWLQKINAPIQDTFGTYTTQKNLLGLAASSRNGAQRDLLQKMAGERKASWPECCIEIPLIGSMEQLSVDDVKYVDLPPRDPKSELEKLLILPATTGKSPEAGIRSKAMSEEIGADFETDGDRIQVSPIGSSEIINIAVEELSDKEISLEGNSQNVEDMTQISGKFFIAEIFPGGSEESSSQTSQQGGSKTQTTMELKSIEDPASKPVTDKVVRERKRTSQQEPLGEEEIPHKRKLVTGSEIKATDTSVESGSKTKDLEESTSSSEQEPQTSEETPVVRERKRSSQLEPPPEVAEKKKMKD